MTDAERDKKLRAERARQARRLPAIQRETAAEIRAVVDEARRRIAATLADQPSDYQRWSLTRLKDSIDDAMDELGGDGAQALKSGARAAWGAGVDLADKPLEAGGIRIGAVLGEIDATQLSAIETFMTRRMRDVATALARRINVELGQVVLGTATPHQATAAIADLLESGGRTRALTLVRTEVGRAYAAAAQQRYAQAAGVLPGLKKQWRRSGKIHSRPAHDAADGQVRAVDEPFIVNGVALMFPRDPAAPPAETINCGCTSLPYMDHWQMSQPGRQPFSDREIALSPAKRALDSGLV